MKRSKGRAPSKWLPVLGFVCLASIAIVQLTYLIVSQHGLPTFTGDSATSQSSLDAVRQQGKSSTGDPTLTAEDPGLSARLVCKDLGSSGHQCKNALREGRCSGETLLRCLETCQQCQALPAIITKALGVDVQLADKLQCVDTWHRCAGLVKHDRCHTLPLRVLLKCQASCGVCSWSPVYKPASLTHIDQPGHTSGCGDLLNVCGWLARKDMCSRGDMPWVQAVCSSSCGLCYPSAAGAVKSQPLAELNQPLAEADCVDVHPECGQWSRGGGCSRSHEFMKTHCRRTCGQCKTAHMVGKGPAGDWQMVGVVWSQHAHQPAHSTPVASGCKDQSVSCQPWAAAGECVKNPIYMRSTCKEACGLCGGANTTIWYLPDPLERVMLNNGVLMPVIGFGTAGLTDRTAVAVEAALHQGYRHLDSAQAREWYREDLVGQGMRSSGVPRDEVFITTKIHPRHLGYETTLAAFAQSLADLQTTYLDLVLLHYSQCWGNLCDPSPHDPLAGQYTTLDKGRAKTWRESWQALEDLYLLNKTRAIGVSNFNAAELQELYRTAKVKPQVLQVHMDPLSQSYEQRDTCMQLGIQMVAFSSLGTQWPTQGPDHHNPVLYNKHLQAMADDTHKTVAQVVLRWVLHTGVIALPRSTNPKHMKESLDVLKFNLDEGQLRQVLMLDGSGPIP